MEWHSRAFMKASLIWLVIGVTLGVAMAVHPPWAVFRAAHLHMNLLGFVAMMIFGVAYHVIPRFVGRPLHRARAASWHWWIANIGLLLMAAGLMLRATGGAGTPILAIGGALSAFGAYTFAFLIWRTLSPLIANSAGAPARAGMERQPLPMAGAR